MSPAVMDAGSTMSPKVTAWDVGHGLFGSASGMTVRGLVQI